MNYLVCTDDKIIKFGKTKDGVQRYKNKRTSRIHQETYVTPTTLVKCLCVFLYYNGLSYRKIAVMMNVSHTSVMNWVRQMSEYINAHFKLSDNNGVRDIEIDELFSYEFKKKLNATF